MWSKPSFPAARRGAGISASSTQAVSLPESLKSSLGVSQAQALLVVGTESGGPADAAGVLLGDMVLGLDGETLEDVDSLRRSLRGLAAGQSLTLHLARGGQPQSLPVTLGARE